jgi:hypothetical protein
VVELVDDDVVERVAPEALEAGGVPESLDRGEEDLGVGAAVSGRGMAITTWRSELTRAPGKKRLAQNQI